MCYTSYQLYQIERAKNPAEVQRADEQAARLASALSSLFRGTARPVGAIPRPERYRLRASSPSDGEQQPMLSVFHRDRETIRHFWGYPRPAKPTGMSN